jgi:hypothetical protein
MRAIVLAVCALLPLGTAHAQQSASFKLTESVLNAGGHPANGAVLTSSSYRIRLDAIGDAAVPGALASPSYAMDGGFVGAYPPAGEVQNVRFTSKTGLSWDAEKAGGGYDLYRGGACLQGNVATPSASDAALPAAGQTFLYLVTAENRLGEEGTRGYQSSGAERVGAPCP